MSTKEELEPKFKEIYGDDLEDYIVFYGFNYTQFTDKFGEPDTDDERIFIIEIICACMEYKGL